MTTDRPDDARPVDAAVSSAIVEAFTVATSTTFEELCQTPVVPGEPYLSKAPRVADRVTAEITLRRTESGRLILAFPRSVLETLTCRYLPDEVPLTPDMVDDAAGEFANVIAGQAKTMLQGTAYHFNLSTPRVSTVAAQPSDRATFLVLPFASDAGDFEVLVCLSLAPASAGCETIGVSGPS